MRFLSFVVVAVVAVLGVLPSTNAQSARGESDALVQNLRYRMIGPFRASRTVGAVGIPSQPNVFYIGVNNGGVWKSDDYGRTWSPIFDDAPTGSVGDIAVSPSHPDIIYVGSGEGLHRPDLGIGDGIFKSTNGGASWSHVGLGDVQQVGRLVVHPTNPDVVWVAGLGHPYGPNEERGVFRTRDGGDSWEKVLYIDHNTGAIQVEIDPNNPDVVFADMWEHREGPWENARFSGSNSGLYKSTDGGTTWRRLTNGLPTAEHGLGRIGVGIAPSNSNRMYATVDASSNGGIYRSDDAGESWALVHTDRRLWGRGGDFAEIRVHPTNPDVVFVGNIAAYRSDNAGESWTSIKGAPGGDDYHRIWINPDHPDIMLFATDQGATVTVNWGRTWSSWYNQPTAQMYHVSTDNSFPYRVFGGQQESGAIGIASRGNGGQISFRDWFGVGADEYAYIAPDPLDPNIIYGGRVVRHNIKTGQTQNVAPEALRSGKYRILRTMPLMFHPADPKMLMFASNVLWKTTNGGRDWDVISPDLSNPRPDVPPSIGDFATPDLEEMPRRGVIYAVDGSPLDVETIWAGTDDGLVHVTHDGGRTWQDVTPPELRAWDKVSQIDAGHFDTGTAYIAVNAIRRDDVSPLIFRTHDGGETWEKIVDGLPESGPVNVVREDTERPGLLFAGTERAVYYSVDDGENWRSLRLNMPATSIRDLVVHEADLVVGSHGRSIYILDDMSPLREFADNPGVSLSGHLFRPSPAVRVRGNLFSDTPLPPEEPTGENPPEGAIIDYLVPAGTRTVTLGIFDHERNLVRWFSSADPQELSDSTLLPHPTYWARPAQQLAAAPGHQRFVWDLRYPPPAGARRQYSIAAVYRDTPSGPRGPFVEPGTYTVQLSIDDVAVEAPLEVRLDPRVVIPAEDLRLQTDLSMRVYRAYEHLEAIRPRVDGERVGDGSVGDPDILYGSIYESEPEAETLVGLQHKLLFMLNLLQGADARPTEQAVDAVRRLEAMALTFR